LPYNAYFNSQNGYILVDSTSPNLDTKPLPTQYTKSATFSNINSLVFPWIPYFSNCKNYGSHIYLFELLENNTACRFPELNSTSNANINFNDPIGDECNIDLECKYDSSLVDEETLKKWFLTENQITLFHITKKPLLYSECNNNLDYSTKILDLYYESFVPVKIIPKDFIKGCVPNKVEMNILYKQNANNEKNIIVFNIYLSNYTSCISELASSKITELDPNFKVIITYKGLSYFDLWNNFDLDIQAISLYFVCIGFLYVYTAIIICLFVYCVNYCTKWYYFFVLRVTDYVYFIIFPMIKGYLFSLSILLVIYATINYTDLSSVSTVLNQVEYADTSTRNLANQTMLNLIGSIALIYFSMKFFIQIPESFEKKYIVRRLAKNNQKEDKIDDLYLETKRVS